MGAILGTPVRLLPLAVSANGYLDSGSPMRGYVVIPTVTSVSAAVLKFAFRPFMAPATDASSGGASTSGSSSAGSSSATGAPHQHWTGIFVNATPDGTYTNKKYTSGDGAVGVNLVTGAASSLKSALEDVSLSHTHAIAHTHSTPDHTHALTYGTFEESYPASHSVKVKTYELVAGVWTLRDTSASITADQASLDLTSVITHGGDWRFEILSDAAQPNGGRLGLDMYGTFELIV